MTELVTAYASFAVTQTATYFLIKRGVRKRGGSEATAYGFGRLALLIQAPILQKQLGLSPEQVKPIVENWVAERADKREKFQVR